MLSWCSICPRRPLQGKLLSSRLRVCFTGISPLRGSLRAAFTGVPLSFWLSLPYQEQPDTCNGDSRSLRYTEGLGVPVAVAIIRIEVLANDYSVFKDQWKGSPPIRSGKSPLTNSHWERPNGYPENEKNKVFSSLKKLPWNAKRAASSHWGAGGSHHSWYTLHKENSQSLDWLFYTVWTLNVLILALTSLQITSSTKSVYLPCAMRAFFLAIKECIISERSCSVRLM